MLLKVIKHFFCLFSRRNPSKTSKVVWMVTVLFFFYIVNLACNKTEGKANYKVKTLHSFINNNQFSHNSLDGIEIDFEDISEEDEPDQLATSCYCSNFLYQSKLHSSYYHYHLRFQQNTAVPLFILHHSWKSFLLI